MSLRHSSNVLVLHINEAAQLGGLVQVLSIQLSRDTNLHHPSSLKTCLTIGAAK